MEKFITFSVNVTFVFVRCFGVLTLLARANNENTPKNNLVASAVPNVVCAFSVLPFPVIHVSMPINALHYHEDSTF